MSRVIQDLRSRIGHHEAEAKRLTRELEAAIMAKFGLVIGETVVTYKGKEFLVSRFDMAWGKEKPWIRGRPRLKSGEWSKKLLSRSRIFTRNGVANDPVRPAKQGHRGVLATDDGVVSVPVAPEPRPSQVLPKTRHGEG